MINQIKSNIYNLLNLKYDTEYKETDFSIRKNADFISANAWTLIFAIFIASIGLNVNSTAVIIGAMLISPLMGPIVAIGYGLGINDFNLIKRSAKNLLIAVTISLLTSTIYFILTPISEAQSELLARTSPTFYDVLIAVFGGATGIVAMSRKEKSNAIPGVAIATALMPPLCTAGYGIANLNFSFMLGAFYLFIINSVFISLSTYIFTRMLNFEKVQFSDIQKQKKLDKWIMIGATLVLTPSIILAWFLMNKTSYISKANKFIESEFNFSNTIVLEKKINYSWDTNNIVVTVVGDSLDENEIKLIKNKMPFYNLSPSALKLNQLSIEDQINQKLNQQDKLLAQINKFEHKTLELQEQIDSIQKQKSELINICNEINSFESSVVQIVNNDLSYYVHWKSRPSKSKINAVELFLKRRLNNKNLKIKHLNSF